MAKLSIVIPIYNVAAYVETCMESVVHQTMEDLEIILVNDGTPDNSMELCRKYVDADPRIRVITKENGGLMSAWIAGVRAATSPYVGFVDSDDWIDLNYFEDLYTRVEQTGSDVVVGQFIYEEQTPWVMPRSADAVYEGPEQIRRLMDRYFDGYAFAEQPISYCRWDKLYRRELILQNLAFLNQKISLGEDVNANAAILPDCRKIAVFCDTAKYHYRINQASIFHTYNEHAIAGIAELYRTLEKIALAKHMPLEHICGFIGNMVFEEIVKITRLEGISLSRKKELVRAVLRQAPDGVLEAYARIRGDRTIRIYCGLLSRGAVGSGILVRQAFDWLHRR